MGWIYLEVLIALLLLIGIVWWTFPTKRDEQQRHNESKTDQPKTDRSER